MHSCWCIFLFECGLNSNLHLNSNLFELEIEKREKIEIEKKTQNPFPARPQATQPSIQPRGPSNPHGRHGPSSLSPQHGPGLPRLPRPAPHSARQRATRPGPPRVAPRSPADRPTPRVRPVVPAALARATAAAPARDSRGFPSQAEPRNHRRPSF